jgi:hypothetical protein
MDMGRSLSLAPLRLQGTRADDSSSLLLCGCDNRIGEQAVRPVLAVCTEACAIITRRLSKSSGGLLNSVVPAARARSAHPAATESGGAMRFNDPTLYGRDEEEEFGDSGAYSESLEEDFEEEEEEEETGVPEAITPEPVAPAPPPAPAAPAPAGGGGKPKAKKKAAKKLAKKKPAKKAKKAKRPARKKVAKKKAAKKPAKKAKKRKKRH